jgi:hypothetical protein
MAPDEVASERFLDLLTLQAEDVPRPLSDPDPVRVVRSGSKGR